MGKIVIPRDGMVVAAVLGLCFAWLGAGADGLEEGFSDPPHEYSMVPLWSWNGTLDPAEIRRQVREMADKGVYGAFMHARAGIESGATPYFSAGWWQAVDAALDEGKRVGFRPWIYDEDKWPSGAAGGRTIARNPERNRQKVLRVAEARFEGPARVKLPFEGATHAVAGKRLSDGSLDAASLEEITESVAGGIWVCPEGAWNVSAYFFEPYGEGEVNYLNVDTVRDFIDITHEEYARRYGTEFGTLIPGVFFDEIANNAGKFPGYHVWAESFRQRFLEMKGYDLIPRLPALVHDAGAATPKIRCDYYDVFTKLYEEAWFDQISRWCGEHGIALTGHTIEELNRYVSQGSYMRTQRHLQIPLTDNEDFRYTWPRAIGAWKPKQIASVAHLYGKSRAGAEAMGGAGWCFTLDMARYGFNMLGVYGVNFFVPHLFHYAQDTAASMDDWPNSWFFRNPYWKYFKEFADHGRRLSYMLTGGEPIADVAILYPETNSWAGYGPGMIEETVRALVAAQIDADVMDSDSLIGAEAGGGHLKAGPMSYQVIILPGVQCLRQSEAEKLLVFAESGGLVLVQDRWPTDSMEVGRGDARLAAFREGMEAQGVSLVPFAGTVSWIRGHLDLDLEVLEGNPAPLRYRHLRKDTKEIYWVVNGGRERGTWRLSFRAAGRPTIWNPEEGSILPAEEARGSSEHTESLVALDAGQGLFVVVDTAESFSEQAAPSSEVTAAPIPRIPLEGSWHFLPDGGQLDDAWRVGLDEARLSLPVMRVRWERPGDSASGGWQSPLIDDRGWREVKVADGLTAEPGAARYRSAWEARFISFNEYRKFDMEVFFAPRIGGKGLRCAKRFEIGSEVTRARIAVVCDSPYTILVDGVESAHGAGGESAELHTVSGLRAGEVELEIVAEDSRALLVEGAFISGYGPEISITTDATWQVSLDGSDWLQAWEYVAPGEAPYGALAHPSCDSLPETVWYRQALPPGTATIFSPEIEGIWAAWVDGVPLEFRDGEARLKPARTVRVLAIRVQCPVPQTGLVQPLQVRCVPVALPLGSWTGQGLAWYSGRGIYSTTFNLDAADLESAGAWTLDLGKVCFAAEVWVNGVLADVRVWPPYRADVTRHLRSGKNRIDVVVANLIANRMRWDIFDSARSSLQSRKWHDNNLLRDGWCLESGLIGPVWLQAQSL